MLLTKFYTFGNYKDRIIICIYIYIHMSLKYNLKNDGNIQTYIYFTPTESTNLDDIKTLLEHYGKIKVYPNNEDVDPYNSYKNVTDYIYRIITNSEFLCKGLNPSYISDVFDSADAIIIIGSSMKKTPKELKKQKKIGVLNEKRCKCPNV